MDIPNQRSSHAAPIPRGGGIGIIVGIVAALIAGLVLGLKLPSFPLLIGAIVIATIGFVDDRWGGLSISMRLSTQIAAAGLIVWHAGAIDRVPLPVPFEFGLGSLGIPVSVVWIVGLLNLYNFLDGIDGFAGLQGVVAGLGLALWGGAEAGALGLAIAGGCAGFLPHNWHPAKVFMGDVGSGTLGFLLAALPFEFTQTARGDAVFVVAVCLWFFLSDGVFTIVRRLALGQKIWEAHRSHLYQRLVQAGLRHDRVVLTVIGSGALLAILAITSLRLAQSGARWAILVSATAAFLVYYWWTIQQERTHLSEAK
jgi:UDP-N-acetylmuramyl pentapeptide phosphotransferase/UDP-N-acetylglucosamine-1-phosphate transferase